MRYHGHQIYLNKIYFLKIAETRKTGLQEINDIVNHDLFNELLRTL